MPSCAIITCRARSNATSEYKKILSFHCFPKEPDIRKQWIDATGRENWIPTKTSTICSRHFRESDYVKKKSTYKYLISGAIPRQKVVRLYSYVSTQTIRRRLKAIARKEAHAEAGKLEKSFSEARKSHPQLESADHIETLSNASFEDNTSDSDNETINSQALKPTSKVSSEDETSTQHVEIATGRKEANPEARERGKSLGDARKGRQEAGTSFNNIGESTNHVNSEDEARNANVETINTKALKVTLVRIRANPQLYIGIPKNCYHLIDIIHKQTEIPTTHILLCLKKIKLDTHIEELADQFGITADEASDIFISNVPALANILHTFVDNYDLQIPLRSEHSSCVIDSLEINVQPSSDNSRELTKTERGNTVKYMVCCTPDGYINYVSPGYGGRQTDDRLLEDTGYLDRLKSGDSVMPNGLRNVESMLLQRGMKVVKPRARKKHTASMESTQNSMSNESQLSEEQVKRLVQRIREFTMVRDRSVLSCDLVRVLDEAVVISCALINLQSFVIN